MMFLDGLSIGRSILGSTPSMLEKLRSSRSGQITSSDVTLDSKIQQAVRVLEMCKEKLKVAVVLPMLLQDEYLLKRLFSPVEIAKLNKYCEKYVRQCTPDIDFNLVKAVELIHSNKRAMEELDRYLSSLLPYLRTFISSICSICDILEGRLKTSASMEFTQDAILHSLYHEQLKSKGSIANVKSQLQDKEVSVQWKVAEKQALITKYQRDLTDRKWQNNIRVQKEIKSANSKMNEICLQSEQHLEKLEEEANKINISYKQILRENVLEYKKLNEKKARILGQLEGWIKKYDTDVAEKILENQRLKNELDELSEKLARFIVEYKKQEKLFNEVTIAKDTEEKMAQEERLMLFMMNRAAKIIQRAWRKSKSKKKKGKGKKGKRGKK